MCPVCELTCFSRLESTEEGLTQFKCLNCSEIIEQSTSFTKNIDVPITSIIDQYKRKFDFYKSKVDLQYIISHSEKNKDYRINENLILEIELVPKSCYTKNIRSLVSKAEWDRIRYVTGGISDFKCEICGERGTKHPVECHEVWRFDDSSHTQTLIKFQSICPLCHQTKHLGFSSILGHLERAEERFMKLNGLTKTIAEKIINKSIYQNNQRSKHDWKLEISLLSYYGITLSPKSAEEILM